MFQGRTRRRYTGQNEGKIRKFYGQHRNAILIVVSILLTVSLLQLIFLGNRALPLSRIDREQVSFSSEVTIAKKLQAEYSKGSVTTKILSKTSTESLAESGVVPDNVAIIKGVSHYPWYIRIIPFSSLVKGALTDQPVVSKVDTTRFALYAEERIVECSVAPKNAGVAVKDGKIELDPAKDGQSCTKETLAKQITAKPLTKQGVTVTVQTTPVKPVRSDDDVQPLLKEAREIANHKLTLEVAGKVYAVDKPTLASWLAFPEDEKTKKISVGLNDEAVKKYLETIQKDIYIAPGTTIITTNDGIETGRVNGASGRGINMEVTTKAIKDQVLKGDGTVNATLASLPPKLAYNRSYSKTPEGLQALVNDLVKDKGDFAISVRKLGDSGVHANGDKQYHPASTYKLFVAYSVLKRVDSGQLSLGQTTTGGQTLGQCLDAMIVNSDNACAEWFGQKIGWSTLTNEARALGARNTTLSRPFVSTTNDQALFLQKLESNQLGLTEPSRARLIDAMKRQVFRKGIPAGLSGIAVADKVGFLEGYLHDSAIVYSPKGVYVLVIYSNNSSWASIADAAKKINDQLQ